MENLNIPVKHRRTGLYVYCNQCKGYSNKKVGRLIKTSTCNHPPAKQVFKIKVHVPGTKRDTRQKNLNTRDVEDAGKKCAEFIDQLKVTNYKLTLASTLHNSDPIHWLLIYQMNRFIEYITNGGFYAFESPKELDVTTIKDYKRNFRYFLESLAGQVDIKTIRLDEIREVHIELFHNYLKKKKYAPKSYNNIMGSMRSFFNHLIDYEELDIKNPFNKVPIIAVHYNPAIYSKEEFEKILSVVTSANGYNVNAKRNYYRSWLPIAFKFGMFTCLRLDELVHLKYSDIFNEDGIWLMKVENIKVNALLGETNDNNKRIVILPVIAELFKVLTEECDFDKNQGANRYIFEPESTRSNVHSIIGKGFTHYKRIAKIEGDKSFKELRTTYTTKLGIKYGEKFASFVTDHSSNNVVDKHYMEKKAKAKVMCDFTVFSKKLPTQNGTDG